MYGMETRPPVVGIDFDDTITKAPEVFKKVIGAFKEGGFTVLIVTARGPSDMCDELRKFHELVDGVVFTDGRAKMEVCELDVDIWIDDWPIGITHDFKGARYVPCGKLVEDGWVDGRKN